MLNLKMFDSADTVIVNVADGFNSIINHSHDFVEVVYVEKGRGLNCINNCTEIEVTAGDIFVIAGRGYSHHLQPFNPDNFAVCNIVFPFEYFDVNYQIFRPDLLYRVEDIPNGLNLIRRIKTEYTEKKYRYEQVLKSLTSVLLSELMRLDIDAAPVKKYYMSINKSVKRYSTQVEEYVHAHYDQKITLDEIAGYCGICKAHLQREFHKDKEVSIMEYIIMYRIEQSCKLLLNTDYSVANIAEMVGFNDLKYFYMKFKQVVGTTPIIFKTNNEGGGHGDDIEASRTRSK